MKTFTLLLTGKKGFDVLMVLTDSVDELIAIKKVVITTDANVVTDSSIEIKKICEYYKIPYEIDPKTISTNSDYTIAIGWKKKLEGIKNLIIIHDSLLPNYRGFAPVVNAMINGDTEIGATAFFAVDEIDAGPVIFQQYLTIEYPFTIAEVIDRMGEIYVGLVQLIFQRVRKGVKLETTDQKGEPTYSMWRDEIDYRINWNDSANNIKRFIDAVGFPYHGASTMKGIELLRILKCEVVEDVDIISRYEHIGKVFRIDQGYPVVVCSSGLLRILEMKLDIDDTNLLPFTKLKTRFK
jgi:methionyl-tRNA formyltransferase